jgi:hypothetical protein
MRHFAIREIDPQQVGQYFSGVQFDGIDIEITEAPVTEKLREKLPWLNTPPQQQVFDRDPPGHLRPEKDRLIVYLIVKEHLFGDGSR